MLNNLIILRHTMDAYKDRLRAVELVTYAELCALKTRQEKMKQFVPWVQYLAFDGEKYYAADNRIGKFTTETFDTFHAAMQWFIA